LQKPFGVHSPAEGAGQPVGSATGPLLPVGYVQSFVQLSAIITLSHMFQKPVHVPALPGVVHAAPKSPAPASVVEPASTPPAS
jgi:hypothetical protein